MKNKRILGKRYTDMEVPGRRLIENGFSGYRIIRGYGITFYITGKLESRIKLTDCSACPVAGNNSAGNNLSHRGNLRERELIISELLTVNNKSGINI